MDSLGLGSSTLEVSRVGLGCNNFGRRLDRERTRRVVEAALDAGITFFDTAESYGDGDSERFLGTALGERRSEAVVATKFGWAPGDLPGGSPERVRRAIDGSLERLGTDVVDLYYYHRPDRVTPLAETLGAMQELVAAGKVRRLGLSNVDVGLLEEAAASGVEVVAVQNRYSLVHREDDAGVLPFCRGHEIGYVPYFPLENGLLTGKYRRGEPAPEGSRLAGGSLRDEQFDEVERLDERADALGCTLLELAIGGLASIDGIASVIAGATTPEQVRANAAAGAWRPSAELESLLA
ncbi:MAG TPA: aldo/keto reductase [Gaiella sp.]|jgi:aryl-alcohol dehydrogenase-like predicted oxidoreductase